MKVLGVIGSPAPLPGILKLGLSCGQLGRKLVVLLLGDASLTG